MVSGTGERTIASWAALALVVGLSLSAAPAAHAAETATAEPSDPATQTTLDESGEEVGDDDIAPPTTDDETTTEPPTPTATATAPPEPGPSEPTVPGQSDPTDTTDTESEGPPAAEFSCPDGGVVAAGESTKVRCEVPENFDLEVKSPGTHGGTAEPNGIEIIYTAPTSIDGAGSEKFTVHAIPIDGGEPLTGSVTFGFDGTANGDGSDEQNGGGETEEGNDDSEGSTQDPSPSPDNSEQTPTPTPSPKSDIPPETEADTDPPAEARTPEATNGTSASGMPQLPGAPRDSSAEPPPGVFPPLPVPGMPRPGSESITPEPTADSSEDSTGGDDRAGEDEAEDDEGLLAQTGPEQVAWAGSLAVAAIILGTTALALSRRQTQRSSDP